MTPDPLLQPFSTRGLTFKNRMVHAPTTMNMSDDRGYVTRQAVAQPQGACGGRHALRRQPGFPVVAIGFEQHQPVIRVGLPIPAGHPVLPISRHVGWGICRRRCHTVYRAVQQQRRRTQQQKYHSHPAGGIREHHDQSGRLELQAQEGVGEPGERERLFLASAAPLQ